MEGEGEGGWQGRGTYKERGGSGDSLVLIHVSDGRAGFRFLLVQLRLTGNTSSFF